MESARPSSAEVDDAFLSLMDELMIPEAQRHAMLVMDDAKKWKMVEESRLGQAAKHAARRLVLALPLGRVLGGGNEGHVEYERLGHEVNLVRD